MRRQEEDETFQCVYVEDPQLSFQPLSVALYLLAMMLTWFPLFVLEVLGVLEIPDDDGKNILASIVCVVFPLRGAFNALISCGQAVQMKVFGRGLCVAQGNRWRRGDPAHGTKHAGDSTNRFEKWIAAASIKALFYVCSKRLSQPSNAVPSLVVEKRGVSGEIEIIVPGSPVCGRAVSFRDDSSIIAVKSLRRMSISSDTERASQVSAAGPPDTPRRLSAQSNDPYDNDSEQGTVNGDTSTSSQQTVEDEYDPEHPFDGLVKTDDKDGELGILERRSSADVVDAVVLPQDPVVQDVENEGVQQQHDRGAVVESEKPPVIYEEGDDNAEHRQN